MKSFLTLSFMIEIFNGKVLHSLMFSSFNRVASEKGFSYLRCSLLCICLVFEYELSESKLPMSEKIGLAFCSETISLRVILLMVEIICKKGLQYVVKAIASST